MSQPTTVTAAFLDSVLTLLAPLFMAATGGDMAAARDAVRSTLDSYHAQGDDQLRLVALIVAFGFGALDALGKAVDPELALNQVLRLRANATALSRAGHQSQAVLDKLRRRGSSEPAPESEPVAEGLPASAETRDLITFVRSVSQARTTPAPPFSRQQRRSAERAAEKARRQQEYQSRRATLLAPRATGE